MRQSRRAVILAAACLAVSACAAPGSATYSEGQVWRYQTRPGEDGSRLYIARIDDDPLLGPIYHLYLDGLRIRNPLLPGGTQDHLPHIPVGRASLDTSVTELVVVVPDPPDIGDGYRLWRQEFDAGDAGVFTLPVKEIVQIVEDAVGRQGGKR